MTVQRPTKLPRLTHPRGSPVAVKKRVERLREWNHRHQSVRKTLGRAAEPLRSHETFFSQGRVTYQSGVVGSRTRRA